MPPGVYIPRFSPESKIECCLIWQVFWLASYEHLPIDEANAGFNSGMKFIK